MSTKIDQEPDDQTQPDEIIEDAPVESSNPARRALYGWLISGGIHLSALVLAWVAVFGAPKMLEQDTPPTRVIPIEAPPPKVEKPKPERTLEPEVQLDATTESDVVSPTSTLDVPVENIEREAETDAQQPKGREEAQADSEMGGSGAFAAIGAGGGGAGMFGNRSGGGRKRAVGKGGGSKGSEGAVEASLRWFKRHQSPNGSWETDKYYQNCTEGLKCEPGGDPMLHGSDCNVAMTGYAVLCFLGAGYDHKTPNKYKTTVKKGIDWLLSVQKADGYLGNRNYEHPIAVMSLAEAYAMTNDPELRGPAQKGINQILAHQNMETTPGPDGYVGGMGWDYKKPNDRNDSSTTGWNIMALKSGLAGGLNIGKGMEGAKHWLEGHWKASNATAAAPLKAWKDITAYDMSRFAYCWHHDTGALDGETGRESIGLVCAIFLGHLNGDVMAESLANTVMTKQLPRRMPTNTYFMYYNTMAIFQMGGERWTKWNGTVRDLLVNSQKKTTDCFDGSWDWGPNDFGGATSGRVLTTAYNTLSLEVYYRYAQVKDMHKAK
jgi:hypothetical protein